MVDEGLRLAGDIVPAEGTGYTTGIAALFGSVDRNGAHNANNHRIRQSAHIQVSGMVDIGVADIGGQILMADID